MSGSSPRRNANPPPAGPEYAHWMAERYAAGETPWDTGVPSTELIRTVADGEFPGKTVLEVGCGTGTNAVELARRGYRVTAVDLVELAIRKARDRAEAAGVTVDFRAGDATRMELGGPYDCLFDSGVYHGIRTRDLAGFLGALRRASHPGTRWLTLAGNPREGNDIGPPTVQEEEFRRELDPVFKILRVREYRLDLGPGFRPLFWSILTEKR